MTAAVIIARGGSKRLPRKNVKLMCGLPLVAWSVIQCKCSHMVDGVYLSTDDEEIAMIGRQYGAEIINRPDWPDADLASGERPVRHAISVLRERFGDAFDTMGIAIPTMPLRFPGDIDRAHRMKIELGTDMVNWMGRPQETLVFKEISPGYYTTVLSTTDRKYLTIGGAYLAIEPEMFISMTHAEGKDHDEQIRAEQREIPGVRAFIEVQPWQGADCDTLDEFEICEFLFEHFILKGRGAQIYYDYGGQP